jgi:hypothetical protein
VSLYARLAALVVLLAIAAGWWKFDRILAAREEVGYQRRAAEDAAAAQAQAELQPRAAARRGDPLHRPGRGPGPLPH